MPPPGHELLLGAIRDNPEDDTVRLAYADWLDENGDPKRAKFIRVQCRLAALGHGPLWPSTGVKEAEEFSKRFEGEQAELILRQAKLWAANRGEWLAELPDLPGCTVWFHRGFASAVLVEHPGGLVRNGAKLFRAAPVTHIVFRGCTPDAVEVTLVQRWFDAVRGLTVGWPVVPAGAGNRIAEVLGRGRHFANLRGLSLCGVKLTNAGAHELAAAPFIRRLARLDLAGNEVRDSGALSVASALDPDRLLVLDLSGNKLSHSCRLHLHRKFGDRVCLEGAEEAVG
jgi:uncharacterized protein (TIGR02996 family)